MHVFQFILFDLEPAKQNCIHSNTIQTSIDCCLDEWVKSQRVNGGINCSSNGNNEESRRLEKMLIEKQSNLIHLIQTD